MDVKHQPKQTNKNNVMGTGLNSNTEGNDFPGMGFRAYMGQRPRCPSGLSGHLQPMMHVFYSLYGFGLAGILRCMWVWIPNRPVNSINNYTRNWYPQIWDLAYEGVVWNEDNQRNEEQQGLGRD